MSSLRPTSPAALAAAERAAEELNVRLASEYGAHLAIMEQRLEAALQTAGFDGALIFAGEELLVHRDDQTYPFKAEPYFKAWVPLTHAPGSFLRIVPGQRPMLVYKQVDDYWYEPPSDPTGYWTTHFDIRVVRSDAEARKLASAGPRWVAIGEAAERLAANGNGPIANDPRVLRHLDYFRAYKTRYELVAMRAAQAIAVRGHSAVAAAFRAGVSELELHHVYCNAAQQRESDLPYSSIVALNEHGATLHYQHLRTRPPPVARSLLIDAGAQLHGYAADITRTYSAAPRDDFAALIAAMETLQQAVCREARNGIDFVALHLLAHRLLATLLREHGIVRAGVEEALAAGVTRAFLPHGLGHLLGLQVHDAAGRQTDPEGTLRAPPEGHEALRLTRVLEPGFVVTIEPGLYFIPSLLKALLERHEALVDRARIERLLPFGGIRIEDNVEITADGNRNLTREAFAALDAAKPGVR